MRNHAEMAELEKQAADLSHFLSGRTPKDIHDVTAFDSKCFKRAHVMLCAEDLLEAAKYALTLLQRLSTEDFAAGGDKPAREKLQAAITKATEWAAYDPRRIEKAVDTDVREAVLNNAL